MFMAVKILMRLGWLAITANKISQNWKKHQKCALFSDV